MVGCTDAEAIYEARSVGRADQAGIANRKAAAKKRAKCIMAKGIKPGDLIAVQNTGWEDQEDNYWIGMAVDARELTGAAGPSYKSACIVETAKSIGNLHGVGCHPGESVIAVRWFERDAAHKERRIFHLGDRKVEVFNSSDVRLSGFKMTPLKMPPKIKPIKGKSARLNPNIASAAAIQESEQRYELPAKLETEIVQSNW